MIRQRMPFLLVAAVVIGSSCRAGETTLSPTIEPKRSSSSMNCTLSASECARLDSAITVLSNNQGGIDCQIVGNIARLLFDAPDYGYRPSGPVLGFDMYVNMDVGPCSSGECRIDNNIYVINTGSNGSFDLNALSGLIGHEIEHWMGNENRGHTIGVANLRQTQCS
jgi:hypothetical protein